MTSRRFITFLCGTLVAVLFGCGGRGGEATGDLLAGKAPLRAVGVTRAPAITDGQAAPEGDEWGSTAGAAIAPEGHVDYDLGQPTPIRAAYLQGDNNDSYIVSVSDDGETFRELWVAPPVSVPGLRERSTAGLAGNGRFVRLSARGGDGLFAVAELALWSERPATFPPRFERVMALSAPAQIRTALLYLVAAFLFALWITGAGSDRTRLAAAVVVPAIAAWFVCAALRDGWPPAGREVAFARAVAAAIALAALVRAAVRPRGVAAHRGVVLGTLATAALLAMASFYNLGHPQFWNHAQRRPELVHLPDMRIYQPFAKYFGELRYDGVYLASVLAFAEDERGGSLASIGDTSIRNLRDQRMARVADLGADISAVRQRFSPERWAAFKSDIAYFREVMGPDFLGTMNDHGANATPVWVWFARLLFAHAPASESVLVVGGLTDAVLLLIMAIAIGRTFGAAPMLAAMTVFGANDLYMFGTNWSGATLRHDWIVALGLAACALKRGRFSAGGVLLGLAATIRFFPGIALVGVGIPAAASVVETWARTRRPPDWRAVLRAHDDAARTIAAALVTMLVAFLVTGVLYGFGAWIEWWHKVALLNRDCAINEVSLRALVGGTDASLNQLLRARSGLYAGLVAIFVGAVVLAARRRPLHEAMLLALPLVLVLTNPSNYYLHLVFLLVLVQLPGGLLAAAAPWLALCIASYWTGLDPDVERHFQILNAMLFVTLGWYYARLLRAEPPAPVPAP